MDEKTKDLELVEPFQRKLNIIQSSMPRIETKLKVFV